MTIAFPKPDEAILSRRAEIIAGSPGSSAGEALIVSEDERRRFRDGRFDRLSPDAAGGGAALLDRRGPRRSSASATITASRSCPGRRAPPCAAAPFRRRTPSCSGSPKMNRVLEVDLADRFIRVESGITNLGISQAVAHEGFFYAPDPSSQLACTIAGNIAMNSGGAHCLKYGVTTNNLLGVTLVLMDGTIVETRRRSPRQRRHTTCWA